MRGIPGPSSSCASASLVAEPLHGLQPSATCSLIPWCVCTALPPPHQTVHPIPSLLPHPTQSPRSLEPRLRSCRRCSRRRRRCLPRRRPCSASGGSRWRSGACACGECQRVVGLRPPYRQLIVTGCCSGARWRGGACACGASVDGASLVPCASPIWLCAVLTDSDCVLVSGHTQLTTHNAPPCVCACRRRSWDMSQLEAALEASGDDEDAGSAAAAAKAAAEAAAAEAAAAEAAAAEAAAAEAAAAATAAAEAAAAEAAAAAATAAAEAAGGSGGQAQSIEQEPIISSIGSEAASGYGGQQESTCWGDSGGDTDFD